MFARASCVSCLRYGFVLSLVLLGAPVLAAAQPPRPADLARATLEDLLAMEITSASRREQRLADTAAAVYVITGDAIRRSGLTEVPELLRLAPGVQVARIDAAQWAISIRGFNTQWSDKLLVLVDGRSVYNRLFSGIYWNSVNLLVEDIDRIEIIRGPGASVWGANAVNGVVNILTKSSADTPGWLVRTGADSRGSSDVAARYGGRAGGATYRLFAEAFERAASPALLDGDAGDDWRGVVTGARADGSSGPHAWMVQGQVARIDLDYRSDIPTGVIPPIGGWQATPYERHATAAHVLGRWVRRTGRGAIELQSFADLQRRVEPGVRHYHTLTLDVDGRVDAAVGAHRFVAGTGFRHMTDHIDGAFFSTFDPDRATIRTFNAYAQDEIALAGDRLRLTVGTKVEHDTLSGWGVQPTARALWTASARQRVWAGLSQSLRAPSRGDVAMRINFDTMMLPDGMPLVTAVVGNPDYDAEAARSVEAGYRVELPQVSVDLAAFHTRHDGLRTYDQAAPAFATDFGVPHLRVTLPLTNNLDTRSHGAELSVRWAPADSWHVDGGYTFFRLTPDATRTSDPSAATFDGNAPRHQWHLRPSLRIGDVQVELGIQRVGALGQVGLPAYTRADLHASWHVAPDWTLQVSGRNLAGDHVEFTGDQLVTVPARDARRVGVGLVWRR